MLELAPTHRQELVSILRQHVPNAKIFAYGSRTQQTKKPHADLDIVIDAEEDLPMLRLAMLRMALEESNLPMRVDWIMAQDAPDFIREQIHSENIISLK